MQTCQRKWAGVQLALEIPKNWSTIPWRKELILRVAWTENGVGDVLSTYHPAEVSWVPCVRIKQSALDLFITHCLLSFLAFSPSKIPFSSYSSSRGHGKSSGVITGLRATQQRTDDVQVQNDQHTLSELLWTSLWKRGYVQSFSCEN